MEYFPHILEHPITYPDGPAPVRAKRRAHLPGLLLGADPDVPDDLRAVSTRQLRFLCNHTYQLLDLDRPSPEARERYDAVVEELERREAHAELSADAEDPRARFRDAALVLPLIPARLRRRLRLPGTAHAAGQDRR
ncbi:hypothetical protein IWX63_002023 [Arthrobacter sp. CAN_A2]|uniref:hypothetical protein n=1 Tax=Arthrobacter sp. CAN_A2 TaxID=2787718 RepID=UPI0018EF6898